MNWSKPLGYYDDLYYEKVKFVLVKETPKAVRIKIISEYKDKYKGLCVWMPKKLTKNYDNYNPNIKTAWFWSKLFRANVSKALDEKTKWNAIYADKSVKEPLRTRTIEKMIDEILSYEKTSEDDIHEHRPDIDEIRNPKNNDRRLL